MLRTAAWQILLNKMVACIFLMFFVLIGLQIKSLFYSELQKKNFFYVYLSIAS